VRERSLREMIRDSRAGSILIAKFIAAGLGGVIGVLTWPLVRILTEVINFVVLHGFRDEVPPLGEPGVAWSFLFLGGGFVLVGSILWLGVAYFVAAWVYKPSPRRG